MPGSARPGRRSRAPRGVALRLLAAVALAVSAYLHVVLASGPWTSGGRVTLAGLFIAQAAVASLVALWVLLTGSRAAWVATAVVGSVSLVALVLSVYVQVPAVGPFPSMYEPFWYREKVVAAVAAALAAVLAGAALLARPRSRPRRA